MKTLAELRAAEKDLVARAALKAAEIKDDLAPEALRAIETDHDALLSDIEKVRGEIVTAEAAERVAEATRTSESHADAIKADRERATGIRKIVRQLGLTEELAEAHIERGTSLNGFRTIAIDEKAKMQEEPNFTPNPAAADRSQHRSYAQPRERAKGTDAARCLIALAASRGSKRDAADFVEKRYGHDGQVAARALATSIGSAGGFLVPPEMSEEVIELLRPASAVMALNPNILPMPSGNLMIPRVQSGASANYVGENQPITASQPSFGALQLSAKKLAALVPISNDMIRFASPQTDAIVRDDMVRSVAMRADLAFIRGSGGSFSPMGLKSFAAAPALAGGNVIAAGVLVGSAYASQSQGNAIQALATVTGDLSRAELALENANIPMSRPGWIFSPRTKSYLMNIRDGLGNQIYYKEMSEGMLRGKPFKVTTQIPNNLPAVATDGATATMDGSEIYLADFSEVFIGEAYGLELDVFPGASYVDANGNLQSGVSNDQTVMRALVQHDMGMRQEAAAAVVTGVRWF